MKLVFICGALELGHDGVGDYTRRLAAELIRQGHEVTALALYDSRTEIKLVQVQEADGISLTVLRIPAFWTSTARFLAAQEWIDHADPQWLSLQFVPFSFQKKGLPFRLGGQLLRLGRGRKWHIMFHELWVGMEKNASQKYSAWGWVQKNIIQSLLLRLQPKVIHTQTQVYLQQLKSIGFRSDYLPLFSNIARVTQSNQVESDREKSAKISFILFGAIHPGAPIVAFADEVARYARQHQVVIELLMVGRCGKEQHHWVEVWQAAGLHVSILGEQSAENISRILSTASIGISTNHIALVEKSGTAMAMLEHGLPVLCVSHAWALKQPIASKPAAGITEYRIGHLEDYIRSAEKVPGFTRVGLIAKTLADALTHSC